MLSRWGIRGKIFAVVAVPILVLVIVAITVTVNAVQAYFAAQNTAQLLEVADSSHALTTALQTERDAGVNFLHFFKYAVGNRDTREADTDSGYQDLLTAVASAPNEYRDDAASARAALDAILTRYGVDANGDFVDLGANSDGSYSLAAARAIDMEVEPIMGTDVDGNPVIVGYEDWPVWPDRPTMRRLEDIYARLEAEIAGLARRTPSGTGIVDEITRYGQLLGVERTSATNLLTTLDTYVIPEGTVTPIIPEFVGTYQDRYQAAQEAVDEGIEDLQAVMERIKAGSENAGTKSSLATALDSLLIVDEDTGLTTLEERRETVRHQTVGPGSLSGWYHDAIAPLLSSLYATAGVLPDRSVAEALTAFAEIDTLIETLRLEEMTGLRIIRQSAFTDAEPQTIYIELYSRTKASLEAAQVAVGRVPGVPKLPNFGISFDATDNIDWQGIRSRIINARTTGDIGFLRTLGWTGQIVQEVEEGILPVQNAVWDKANNLSSNSTQSALVRAILTAVGAAAIVGLSLFIAWIIAQRIIGPLRRLTTTATAVRQELPRLVERVALPGQTVDVSEVQIPVESSDEVGRLAEAFNAVNAATLTIAGEQAALRGSISEMFVNVARRDQVLLNRQLASIDEMERSQDDPDTLTRLFALDHLATRMRRNSESLLVLAGIDTGRRMRRPMPLSDVIRTASSEIELYERIQLELDADPSMVGHSALTAGHLFAELLENATVFSDPGTPVVVRTTRKEESVIVEIVDLGIGMTPEELHEANARVRSTAASEILGAQRLGLFVVGRIARRLGARVEIASEEGKGTTATVTMPLSLFDFTAEPELDRSSESPVDKALHVPTALIGHHGEDEVMDVYSDDVMTPAIAGASYQKPDVQKPEEVDEEIALLIQEDAELAPETEEVDLTKLVEGKTSKGLPARKRRSSARTEAARDTTSVLGLPETPTSGQLAQMNAGGQGFTPEDTEEASTAEQRSALFRGFRARRGEEGIEVDPNVESLGHVARRDAVTADPAADEPVPLLEETEPEPEAELVPEPEAELVPEPEAELVPEPEAELVPEPEAELVPEPEFGVEPDVMEEDEPAMGAESEASSQEWDISDIGEIDETMSIAPQPDVDVTLGSIQVPEAESVEESGTADAWEVAAAEPEEAIGFAVEDVGEMPEPATEDGSRFSWESVPAADEPVPTLEEVLQPKPETTIDEPVEATPAKGKKPKKDKRGLFGGRKKKESPAPPVEEVSSSPEDVGTILVTPPSGEVQLLEEEVLEPTAVALEAEQADAEVLGTDVAAPGQPSEAEYDEWGLPVARSWPPAETLDDGTSPAPAYDEWGLPVVDGPAATYDLDLPPEGVPSPMYPEEPMEQVTPTGAPIVDDSDATDLPPLTTDEWAMPSAEEVTMGEPEAITWGVETVEVAEPVVDSSDLTALPVTDETPYYETLPVTDEVAYANPTVTEETPDFETLPVTDEVAYATPAVTEETPYYEAPPATEEVAYVAMPPVTGEIPDLTVQPIQPEEIVPSVEPALEQAPPPEAEYGALPAYEEPQALPEPQAPLEAIPSFDALLSPPAEGGLAEGPAFTGEIPDLNVQPVSGEFFSPLAVPEQVDESAVPALEPEVQTAPAMDEAVIPDMPPPTYDVPDLPPPTVPAYGAEGYVAEPYGGEGYGTAALGYSPDEFAKPYGWEGAGASALAASEGEQVQGGYSPEAFVPTAPVLPDGSEAEMTSAVFSEFSSLATERPKVVRTKAGLQRRTKSEEEETLPPPTDEIEIKPITRDPEAVRSNFSSFHSATNRARDAGDSGPDVRGIDPNEVTP